MKIPFVKDLDLLQVGITSYCHLDFGLASHLAVVGTTGSGKSYCAQILAAKISKYLLDSRIVICDYKKSTFAAYLDCPTVFTFNDVEKGLEIVYQEFNERLQENDEDRNKQKIFLIFDEYSAFISSLEKKKADEIKSQLGNILLMGRSLGVHVILILQRADSEFFRAGTRDQLSSIVILGNPSKEQKAMLLPDYKDQMENQNRRGQGYFYDGLNFYNIQVPTLSEKGIELRDKYIRRALHL